MTSSAKQTLLGPLFTSNPVVLQALGICSALAVTTSLLPTLLLCASLTSVMVFANMSVSLIRNRMPHNIRIIIQITIISSLVIIVDQVLKTFAYEISKQLSVFVGLIITNCIVLARTEGFALKNNVGMSFLDGLGNGLGYSLVLIIVAGIRELLGSGTLLGFTVFSLTRDEGWFQPLGIMQLAPSGFFIIGFLIWFLRTRKNIPAEKHEYHPQGIQAEET
jgi:Na+-transporting NADH:ubiquinone oxidoreductase subunit D